MSIDQQLVLYCGITQGSTIVYNGFGNPVGGAHYTHLLTLLDKIR